MTDGRIIALSMQLKEFAHARYLVKEPKLPYRLVHILGLTKINRVNRFRVRRQFCICREVLGKAS